MTVTLLLDRSDVLPLLHALQLQKRTQNADTLHGCVASRICRRLVQQVREVDAEYAEDLTAWLDGREPPARPEREGAERTAGRANIGSGV